MIATNVLTDEKRSGYSGGSRNLERGVQSPAREEARRKFFGFPRPLSVT